MTIFHKIQNHLSNIHTDCFRKLLIWNPTIVKFIWKEKFTADVFQEKNWNAQSSCFTKKLESCCYLLLFSWCKTAEEIIFSQHISFLKVCFFSSSIYFSKVSNGEITAMCQIIQNWQQRHQITVFLQLLCIYLSADIALLF